LVLAFLAIGCNTASAQKPVVLVFGDSISAGYGMEQEQSWVSLLQQRIDTNELGFRVVNASVSGETTGGGVTRLPKTLELHDPALVVLELGGNDGLRGYPINKIRDNLRQMTRDALEHGATVLLIGMVLPPNYGRRYVSAFEASFHEVASEADVKLLPYLLDGVTTDRELIQRDGIHPTSEAQVLLLEDVWPVIRPMLDNLTP
tara:strand:+ start:3890 stop:4498 length:609 start_codon:yes stop_codon:yes gene_type:complete